jgi:hypothetical protein
MTFRQYLSHNPLCNRSFISLQTVEFYKFIFGNSRLLLILENSREIRQRKVIVMKKLSMLDEFDSNLYCSDLGQIVCLNVSNPVQIGRDFNANSWGISSTSRNVSWFSVVDNLPACSSSQKSEESHQNIHYLILFWWIFGSGISCMISGFSGRGRSSRSSSRSAKLPWSIVSFSVKWIDGYKRRYSVSW